MKIRVLVEQSRRSGAYLAYCPEVPGCSATGRTREQAMDRLRDRIRVHLADPSGSLPPGVACEELEL